MADDVARIRSEQNRQLIPAGWRLTFDGVTSEALTSMCDDAGLPGAIRTYARYELAYRDAWGIFVDIDPESGIERHHDISTEAKRHDVEAMIEAEMHRLKRRADAMTSRMTLAIEHPVFVDMTCSSCGRSFKGQKLHGPLGKRPPLSITCLEAGVRQN